MMWLVRSLVFASLLLAVPGLASAAPKRVLVFGDSNTWGWIPTAAGAPSERYPAEQQWPSVAQAKLGADYELVVDALSGRTTDAPDPTAPMGGAALDGASYLPAAVAAHLPLDLVVIMLGTNDTKAQFKRSPFRIALGAGRLVDIVQGSANMFGGGWYRYPAPQTLLVAPPPMPEQTLFTKDFAGGTERSRGLARSYALVAQAAGVPFFDAGSVISTDGVDAVHLSAESQRKLGEALAEEIRKAVPSS